MHDPFQSYQTGAFAVGATPFGAPYGGQQISGIHPALAGNPAAALCGVGGYAVHPLQLQQLQQLQHLQQLQQQIQQLQTQAPGIVGQQNPLFQNPLAQGWHNPLLAAGMQPQYHNPMLGYQGWPQPALGYPQTAFGYPLAPQSLIGSVGQAYGPMHPLAAQLALRSFTGGGISPWGY